MLYLKRRYRSWQLTPIAFMAVRILLDIKYPVRTKFGAHAHTPILPPTRHGKPDRARKHISPPLGTFGIIRCILILDPVVPISVACTLDLTTRHGAKTQRHPPVSSTTPRHIPLLILLRLSGELAHGRINFPLLVRTPLRSSRPLTEAV